MNGREAVKAFLTRKWEKGLDYRLKKERWTFGDDRIAVRFEYDRVAGAMARPDRPVVSVLRQ